MSRFQYYTTQLWKLKISTALGLFRNFSSGTFTPAIGVLMLLGFAVNTRAKDKKPLNREQTEEWKGREPVYGEFK